MLVIGTLSIKKREILIVSNLVIILSSFCLVEIPQVYSIPRRIMSSPLTGRYGHSLVYDPDKQQVILFGGISMDNTELDDMWVYDCKNNIWTEKHVTNKPPARSGHGMVYDSINHRFFLFGGGQRYGWCNDTWIYDSTKKKWTEVFPQQSPSPRGSVAMYFDPNLESIILFGGYDDLGESANETWIYSVVNNTWTLLNNISIAPPPRYGSQLVYDSVNQRGILFGGRIVGRNRLNDTWVFNPSNKSWNQLRPIEGPSARYWYGMAYDSSNQVIILFGGSCNLDVSQETWIFNVSSNHWIQMNPEINPPSRCHHELSFDANNGKMILFGGIKSGYLETYNDTWTYSFEENTWAIQNPQIIEYSPVSGFSTTLILFYLIILCLISPVRRKNQKKTE
ncbi:MAG: Kelch repeat-containing protein [Promethearchaeota archaeon]